MTRQIQMTKSKNDLAKARINLATTFSDYRRGGLVPAHTVGVIAVSQSPEHSEGEAWQSLVLTICNWCFDSV